MNLAAEFLTALSALKIKRGQYFSDGEGGVRIVQQGKPDLILTFEAARRFAHEVEEARA
jgi:hypothetical protein